MSDDPRSTKPLPDHVDIPRLLAALQNIGAPDIAADVRQALEEAARDRVEEIAKALRIREYSARAARRSEAFRRIGQAALSAAADALQDEFARDPAIFTEEWGYPMDSRELGALNIPACVGNPASNAGLLHVTIERTRR